LSLSDVEQALDDCLLVACDFSSIELICQVLDALGVGGVRVHTGANFGETEAVVHTRGEQADKFASGTSNSGSSKNLVSALLDVNLDEAADVLADGAIATIVELSERVELLLLLFQLPRVLANVSDLGGRVRSPGQKNLSAVDASVEESISDDGAGVHIRVVSELVAGALARVSTQSNAITDRVNVRVGSSVVLIGEDTSTLVKVDVSGLTAHSFDIGCSARGEENRVESNDFILAVLGVLELDLVQVVFVGSSRRNKL